MSGEAIGAIFGAVGKAVNFVAENVANVTINLGTSAVGMVDRQPNQQSDDPYEYYEEEDDYEE